MATYMVIVTDIDNNINFKNNSYNYIASLGLYS